MIIFHISEFQKRKLKLNANNVLDFPFLFPFLKLKGKISLALCRIQKIGTKSLLLLLGLSGQDVFLPVLTGTLTLCHVTGGHLV